MEDKISIILPIFNVVLLMKVERLLMNMMRNTTAAKPSTWKKIPVQPMVPVTEVLKSAAAITLCF